MTSTRQSASQALPNVDLRGFSYALAPYLRKQEWQMERLQASMARLQQDLTRSEQALLEQQALLHSQAEQLRHSLQGRPDPQAYRRGLAFLSELHGRIDLCRQDVQAMRERKAELQAECLVQQRSIDGLLEHRTKAVREYALEVERAAAAEADRDWVGRLAMRQPARELRLERNE